MPTLEIIPSTSDSCLDSDDCLLVNHDHYPPSEYNQEVSISNDLEN